ncbi:MAG TPA: polyprenyl synthetase family protein [Anaerolineae bacterium]|nr:polyprenyl synthetase family protein [Anaerolineae bacterium]
MELHTQALDFALDLPFLRAWPEVQELLQRGAPPNAAVWKMPLLACEAVGGTPDQVIPVSAALACLQLNIILIDDLLDADPRGEYHRIGAPATANIAAALQAAGLEAIMQGGVNDSVKLAALSRLNQMMLTTAFGQHFDVQNPADEEAYWRVVRTKSSPFFGAALQLGALFAGASAETAAGLGQIGQLYGALIQIHDDLDDAMAVPANADWLQGRSSLPILFARLVDHPDRPRFLELCRSASDSENLAEAQAILIRCGAISYCVDQLTRRYDQAEELLRDIPLAHRAGLADLLEAQIRPVREFFRAAGVMPPNAAEESRET